MRPIGGGDAGHFLDIACVPDETLKTAITTLLTEGAGVEGRLVKLTWAGNYQVTNPEVTDIPDGQIITCEKDSYNGYILGVRLFHYKDQNDNHHTPVNIKTIKYSGPLNLHNSVVVSSAVWDTVANGSTGGWGAVIAKDTNSGAVDVLF